jgi:protein TonB
MRSNLWISCFVAVFTHALVLSLPLYKASSHPSARSDKPIALIITQPEAAVPAAPLVQALADIPRKPPSPIKKELSLKETPIPKKGATYKKKKIATPAVEPSFSEEKVLKGQEDPIVSSTVVETPSVPKDVSTEGRNGLATLRGHQRGQDAIVFARPKYKQNPLPHYPGVARRKGYEGRTLLRVEVLESGKVGRIEIATSSGFKVLDKAALRSVKDWAFVPGTRNGEQIDQWVMVPIRFSLR